MRHVLLSNPRLWQEFDFMRFVDRQTEGEWQYFTSTRDATFARGHIGAAGE